MIEIMGIRVRPTFRLHLKLALRNLFRQGRRSVLSLAAVILGVAGLIVAGGFVEDIFVQLGEGTIHSQLGHLQIHRSGYLQKGAQRPLEYLISDPQQVVAGVARIPEFKEAMARLDFSALLNNGRRDAPALVEGVEPAKERQVSTLHRVLDGRRLATSDMYGMYVGEGLAQRLSLHAGQTVSLVTNTAGGALNTLDFEIVGIFRSYSKDYDDRAVNINLGAAHELLQTTGVNTIVILLGDTSATARFAIAARAMLPASLEVSTWYDLSDFYRKTVELFKRQFGFLQVVILLLIVLSVLNTINLAMFERRGEFATMRAIGNSNRGIFAMIVLEAGCLGIIGSAVGAIVGVAAAYLLSAIGIPMPPPPNAELGYTATIRVGPGEVLIAVSIGIAASLLASVAPSRRISRMPIVDGLRQNV
jgi:putative ABC transport system permease protein